MNIIVLGAGAWGTAIAISAATHPANHVVTLWGRNATHMQAMRAARENVRYLPGQALPATLNLSAHSDPASLARSADLVVLATPVIALRSMLRLLRKVHAPITWLCKGFEADTGRMAHEVCAEVAPELHGGVLSGPSFAQEVAQGLPAALVATSIHPAVCQVLTTALHSPALRIYTNDDVIGVEVGGAVKNVLAIATGLCDGLALGLNARAALVTRGLAEMTRLGLALGARRETFMGLSGVGDLLLTATGNLSRNRRVGLLLAQGQTLTQATAALGHVAEGVHCARTVLERAQNLGVDMPITQAVVHLLDARIQPADAVATLMERVPSLESFL